MAAIAQPRSKSLHPVAPPLETEDWAGMEARQLTVMFCDLVGSTPLAASFLRRPGQRPKAHRGDTPDLKEAKRLLDELA